MTPKFSFVPERQLGKDIVESYKVSINKGGILSFPSSSVSCYDLGGKYIRLFADLEKKVIGWTICEGKTELEVLNDARIMKTQKFGNVNLGITKLLKKLGFPIDKPLGQFEVKKYTSPLEINKIWYIQL